MEPSSWMRVLVCAAGLSLLPQADASPQDGDRVQNQTSGAAIPGPKQPGSESKPAQTESASQLVKLNLLIAGLSPKGCDVEVKAGNHSCRFKSQVQHVGARGELSFQFKDIEVRGADRNCTFAITVREGDREPKTIYRGFRLSPRDSSSSKPSVQSFTCYMNSPSKLADLLDRGDRKRR